MRRPAAPRAEIARLLNARGRLSAPTRRGRWGRHAIAAPKGVAFVAVVAVVALTTGSGVAAPDPDIPPAVDPGTPTYVGADDPVPDEPVEFDPTTNMLERIYQADRAAGADSYWVDRILGRPAGGSGGNSLYTKGRALYMYTHNPNVLGFAGQGTGANQGGGGFAYREAISAGVTNLYTVAISGANLTEDTAQRAQYPSYWSSVHTAPGLSVEQRKFITHNNVAVTELTLTNTSDQPTTRTITASTPAAVTQSTSADGTERTGTFSTRYNVTRVSTRFSGDGFTASGNDLVRTVSLEPGESTTVKLQVGAAFHSDERDEHYALPIPHPGKRSVEHVFLGKQRLTHRGRHFAGDEARAHGIHGYLAARELLGNGPCQPNHTGL